MRRPEGDWKYENGNFYGMTGLGGFMPQFSIVTSFVDNGDDTYNVEFVDFIDNNYTDEDRYDKIYLFTLDEALKDKDCEFEGRGSAVLKYKEYGDDYTYEVLEYIPAE